jgi:glycine/D-amino acid oxidase-like deaminating enzyme
MTTEHITKISETIFSERVTVKRTLSQNISPILSLHRLLHPLTPRGKMAYMGLEGLKSSKELIYAAAQFEKDTILRDEIYRMALNEQHESALKEAALSFPEYMQWMDADELDCGPPSVLGALRIHSGGCNVVHLPTYIKGLWSACRSKGTGEKVWEVDEGCTLAEFDWNKRLSAFDAVVLAAGAGLFQNSIIKKELPMQLVRGQSIELDLGERTFDKARLCGKYAVPLLEHNRVLIGATQEFKDDPLDPTEVEAELKKRSNAFTSDLWDGSSIYKITEGFRVQSNRGPLGRMPILGRFETPIHHEAWVFTGLSSRGLLYHALFADSLSDMILGIDDNENPIDRQNLNWWQK